VITGPINGAATANAPRARSGMSSGIVNVGRMAGATLGVAILGTLFGAHASARLTGMRMALGIAGLAELLGSAVALVGLRRDSLRATG
jgi:MFS transporter, DHA2 family, methylenomycin A resistance protein